MLKLGHTVVANAVVVFVYVIELLTAVIANAVGRIGINVSEVRLAFVTNTVMCFVNVGKELVAMLPVATTVVILVDMLENVYSANVANAVCVLIYMLKLRAAFIANAVVAFVNVGKLGSTAAVVTDAISVFVLVNDSRFANVANAVVVFILMLKRNLAAVANAVAVFIEMVYISSAFVTGIVAVCIDTF